MAYNVMSMPLSKEQTTDGSKTAQSYHNYYKYEDSDHPSAPSEIGHEHYTYDANGNPTRVENDSTAAVREMYWDEDNRLMVLSDNGKTSRYTYNHAGERAVKSHGSMEGVYINGAPQGITFHETDEYTLYPASIISVNKNRYTKHYFIGDKRIASRIGSGSFNNVYGQNGSFLTAGQQDYAERMSQIENQREDYYRELGIAPGIPTMKGSYGDPENTGVGYNTIIKELGDHTVPAEWAQYVKNNTEANSAPGAPIQWDDPSDPETALPGYGFIADNSGEPEETFYYHSDHLGSISYITDGNGNITQYDAYLPYGELLVDEHSSSEEMPYKFNGKELDEETGLYYYGARYMQPVASIWYGVDPLTEKYTEISGYVYCHTNPIRLVDPNGCEDTETEKPDSSRKIAYFYIVENRYKDVYKNHLKGMKGKMAMDLTYDSNKINQARRRREATNGISSIPLMDRDEFPYACTEQGGKGASVSVVPRDQNRRHGGDLSTIIKQNKLESGDIIRVILVPNKDKKRITEKKPSLNIVQPKPEYINWLISGKIIKKIMSGSTRVLQRVSPIFILPLPLDYQIDSEWNNNNVR